MNAALERAVREGTDFYLDEYRIHHTDGSIRFLRAIGHRNPSGEPGEYVGVTMDITERKRAEEERERLRQLEAELAHINRVNMMGELAAALAHEIKQPIAASITSANALLRWLAHDPPDLERARATAARIEQDANRAADVINSLQSFYRTGTPAERQIVDVKETIGEMTGLLRGEADRHSIKIHTELGADTPNILANRVQLQQVFMNLMLNAIEAMKDTGGELTIRSRVNPEGRLIVSISDTGIGLPARSTEQIFDPFHTTKPQGTGMGLTITRSIVESYGGRVWATANRGRGRNLPLHTPQRNRGFGMKPAPVPTVFIIDDDRGMRQAVQDLVESVGLRAESFATGQEFLSRQPTSDPSCLVLDVRLPQMSGLDFQRQLTEIGMQIPIIFITAHGDVPMSVRALKSGAVEFLTKPFRDQDLLDAIQQALQRDRAAREQQAEILDVQERYQTLTPREREVMTLVVSGLLNKQIASEIGASEATVKIHRGNMMQKMQVGSLIELVRMADKLKLIPLK